MIFCKKRGWFSQLGISIIGGVGHNVGQLCVAAFVVENSAVFYYLPFLLAGFLMKQLFFIQKGFGATYAKGIRAGICLSASKAGRAHKVPFTGRNLLHYCSLQLQLWVNLFRRV